MEHPQVARTDSIVGVIPEKDEIVRALGDLTPAKRKAFLDFLAALPEDEERENKSGSVTRSQRNQNRYSTASYGSRGDDGNLHPSSGTPSNNNSNSGKTN
jgi:hypothetical protein